MRRQITNFLILLMVVLLSPSSATAIQEFQILDSLFVDLPLTMPITPTNVDQITALKTISLEDSEWLTRAGSQKHLGIYQAGQLAIYDLENLPEAPLMLIDIPDGDLWSLKFNFEGNLLAVINTSGIRVWDIPSGELVATMNGHDNLPVSLAFNQSSTILASVSGDYIDDDNAVILRDLHNSGESVDELDGGEVQLRSLAASPMDNLLIVTSWDDVGYVWNLDNRDEVEILGGGDVFTVDAAFSPDGSLLATTTSVSLDSDTILWNTSDFSQIAVLENVFGAGNLTFNSDSRFLALTDRNGDLWVWDTASITQQELSFEPPDNCLVGSYSFTVTSIAFSPDSSLFVTSHDSPENGIRLWDMASKQFLVSLGRQDAPFSEVFFTPDAKYLISIDINNNVKVWGIPQ